MGAGTLASYAQPGQRWTFYEIDAAVERIARDPRFFTYLRDCEAEAVDIILGDARQRLQGAPDDAYQLIVLDAFSSDALPVHLLSREAIRLYRAKLAPGGLLLFNLTNRYLDLDPVIGRQASRRRPGLPGLLRYRCERRRETGRQAAVDLGRDGRGRDRPGQPGGRRAVAGSRPCGRAPRSGPMITRILRLICFSRQGGRQGDRRLKIQHASVEPFKPLYPRPIRFMIQSC